LTSDLNCDVLLKAAEGLLNNDAASLEARLQALCQFLKDHVAHYDWVGFYLVDPNVERELVLGPYAGAPTEHTRIPFGQGICGQAAATEQTFIVQDVALESNYLSCSPDVRSEIVLPILKGDAILGELDIDSHQLAPFTDEDARCLGAICDLVASLFA
jgi:L-methionine (R)-S-oxide reductase